MLRLALISDGDPSADEVCRERLKASQNNNNNNNNNSDSLLPLHDILSAKTELHDDISSAWAVESVPKTTRYDDVSTTTLNNNTNNNINNNASATTPSSTPFRTSTNNKTSSKSWIASTTTPPPSHHGGLNDSHHHHHQQQQKYVAVNLGSCFTQELCNNHQGSLPVQVLKRLRASGSNTVSILCNVSCIITQTLTNQITVKDLTEQLLPEEFLTEAVLFSSSSANDENDHNNEQDKMMMKNPNDTIPQLLETNQEACSLLSLPSDEFKFVRCGADSYGGMHTTRDRGLHQGGDNSTLRSANRPSSYDRKPADAALIESLIESLAESESFLNAIGRTSIVFSFIDETTHGAAAAQVWFVSDAHMPMFGTTDYLTPGIWRSPMMSSSSSIVRAMSQETVLFATTSRMAAGASSDFDRIVNVAVSAATITGEMTTSNLDSSTSTVNNKNNDSNFNKRTQLLQIRQQQERMLEKMQRSLSQQGSSADKLAAERQYQRLLMGEIELLERRIEEVKTLTEQEKTIAGEIDVKQETVRERVKDLEEQKKHLVAESRNLSDENRSNNAVAEALQHQIQLLEHRLSAASSSIVAHRQQNSNNNQRSSSSSSAINEDSHQQQQTNLERQLQSKHELAVAEAQKHFAQIQQKVADDARDAEEQFNADMRQLQAEISSLQQQAEQDGTKLGEMRANFKANENLRNTLEKEYNDLRDAMNTLMSNSPELAAPNPGTILDERREKLQKGVVEYKQQLADLKIKLEQVRSRRETVEENVLSSERYLQRNLSQIQLRIPPQLETQREHCEDEEKCMRDTVELEYEATLGEMSNEFYLSLYNKVHNANTRRHQKRHEELRFEIQVAEENLHETEDKLRQAQATSDVFAQRIDQCAKEQERLREDHRKTIVELQQQLITAESEPVEEAVRREMKLLQQRIASTNAEIELIQGSMMKSPGVSKTSAGSILTAAAALGGSATTYASHRTLRAAAPVASEIRQRLKMLRRDSYKRQRKENAKAAELEQRLSSRRGELNEKATLISTIRSTINELHEQLQMRTVQTEERTSELEQLRRSEEAVINDLQEELDYAKEVSNRHKNENRLQLTRVTQVMQEQEQELARSRHEVAKLERKRNEIVRRMSESNEATLVMELEHEQQKRDELRVELEKAGVAASPDRMRSMSGSYYSYSFDEDNNSDDYGGEDHYGNNNNNSQQHQENFFTPNSSQQYR